jgi:hypothetical protein
MRFTDDRYAGERQQFDLAVRLIAHQARTHIIAALTGFSQDRIRKLYGTYFRRPDGSTIRRQRGKSPTNVAFFVRNASVQAEASTLVYLFGLYGILKITDRLDPLPRRDCSDLVFGELLCRAYETYTALYPRTAISFERSWNLYRAITSRKDALLADCLHCGNIYVQDALALDRAECPPCRLSRTRGAATHL